MLAAVLAPSCSLLDITPDGRVTLEDIFADHDMTGAYLNGCYNDIPGKGGSYYWVCNAPTALSDEGWYVYGVLADGVPSRLYLGTASAASHPLRDYSDNPKADYYGTYMWQLRQTTTFLQHIDQANVRTEAERNRWRAEAHVLRAYYMSEMLKWFGAFAYNPDGYPDDFDYKTLTKPSIWWIAEQIDAECTAAINTAELPWRIDSSADALRATKALAWCIKSKMYLFAASPLFADIDEYSQAEQKAHWQKAFEVNQEAVRQLEANGYALKTMVADPDLYKGDAAAYQELFTSTSLTSASDPETIWHGRGNQRYTDHSYIGSNTWSLSTRAGIAPVQELVDAYEVLSADGTKAEPLLDLANPYNADKSPNYNPAARALGYDPEDPYSYNLLLNHPENEDRKVRRDPRMAVTIICDGDPLYWKGETKYAETYVGGDNGISDDPKENRFTRTGYYFRKYIGPNHDIDNGLYSAPWKYFRLAEIKLNLAEAAAEAGELGVAEAQVNDVRRRVHMPDLPAGLSQEEMIRRVRQERRVELCYEECRYFDVRRWSESYASSKLYKENLAPCGTLTSMWITLNEDGTKTYQRRANLKNLSTRYCDVLLPIPQTEAQTLFSLTNKTWQNYGW